MCFNAAYTAPRTIRFPRGIQSPGGQPKLSVVELCSDGRAAGGNLPFEASRVRRWRVNYADVVPRSET